MSDVEPGQIVNETVGRPQPGPGQTIRRGKGKRSEASWQRRAEKRDNRMKLHRIAVIKGIRPSLTGEEAAGETT